MATDRVESGHVDRLAGRESPPRVEGVKASLEVRDPVDPVAVEQFL
jgi:hypothetical protein